MNIEDLTLLVAKRSTISEIKEVPPQRFRIIGSITERNGVKEKVRVPFSQLYFF
jgi:hypothetical protein